MIWPSNSSLLYYRIQRYVYTMVKLKSSNLPYYLSVMGATVVMWASPQCKLCKQQLDSIDSKKLVGLGYEFLYIDGHQWDSLCDDWEIDRFPTYIIFDRNSNMVERMEYNEFDKLKEIWKE